MAGAGLLIIKRRIKSITNTKKITRAMGLVATAKLRKSRVRLGINTKYTLSFDETMEDIVNSFAGPSTYKQGNGSKKVLYVVITSDSGLCGGFNSNILNMAEQLIGPNKENSLIIVVGQKGRGFFNKRNLKTEAEYVDLPDLPALKDGKIIANHILSLYDKSEVGEVYILYTKFGSVLKQTIMEERILPLKYNEEENYERYIEFEPDISQVFNSMIPLYLTEKVMNYMINSKSSEQASRMSAMDGATKNANDLLDALNLKYNRVRQGVITQEISEIVGGAEALK
ncbi:MAG TPA: ATP synthase F1 subunit gamma [Clostridiaceae bacterium]